MTGPGSGAAISGPFGMERRSLIVSREGLDRRGRRSFVAAEERQSRCGVDHLRVCRSPRFRQVSGTDFPGPRAAPSARSGYRSPAADHRPRGNPLFTTCAMPPMTRRASTRSNPADIHRQNRLDPLPLFVAQPKQIPAHNFTTVSPTPPLLSARKD